MTGDDRPQPWVVALLMAALLAGWWLTYEAGQSWGDWCRSVGGKPAETFTPITHSGDRTGVAYRSAPATVCADEYGRELRRVG